MTRLDTAFRRPEGWEEFADACGELADAKAWASTNDTRISAQVAARDRLPAHYSTAAVDAAAQQLRGMFEHRSFALRNARRTNLLLGLAQLHLNNTDDPDTYHRILREHAERAGGQPAAPQQGPPRLSQHQAHPLTEVTLTPGSLRSDNHTATRGGRGGTIRADHPCFRRWCGLDRQCCRGESPERGPLRGPVPRRQMGHRSPR